MLQYKCKSKTAGDLSDFDEKVIRHCVCVRLTSLENPNLFFIIISRAPFVSLPKGAFCYLEFAEKFRFCRVIYMIKLFYERNSNKMSGKN